MLSTIRILSRTTSNAVNKSFSTALSDQTTYLSSKFAKKCICSPSAQISRMISSSLVSGSKILSPTQTTYGHVCSSTCRLHTEGDKELTKFLEGEIKEETRMMKEQPTEKLTGFKVESGGGRFTLTKSFNDENIVVTVNINHSVGSEEADMPSEDSKENPEPEQMVSKPDFTVEIMKNNETFGLNCSFVRNEDFAGMNEEEGGSDIFVIDEVALFEGDWNEDVYAVSGEIIDGNLYDLLMNMLEERGISNEFAAKLSDYSTSYEHSQYIDLLTKMKSFVSK